MPVRPPQRQLIGSLQIAGIFVGFGGIYGSIGDFHARTQAAKLLQSVVTMNLGRMTILARLCPS